MDPHRVMGSYAGAMGIPQFIASSHRSYAVDFDGDGLIDIIDNIEDAIGSVGNYFRKHGWIPGAEIASPVSLPEGKESLLSDGLKPDTTAGNLAKMGLPMPALPADTPVKLLAFENEHSNEHWLGFQNFYVITRYNNSMLYALAVFQLAEEIRAHYTR